MADEIEKLRRFKQAVLAETDAQVERMLEEARAEHDAVIKAAKADAERKLNALREDINSRAEQQLTRELSTAELTEQRKVLLRREELADSVFDLVREKLAAFRASDKYVDWLCKNVKSASERFEGCEAEVAVSPDDLPRVSGRLKNAVADPSITLGGAAVRFSERGVLLDLSFDSLLERERAEFCRNAGL
ncbi:MAG: hypothetical protein IKP95_02990 [Ruminococcus sp.]|nr:hypothetical protein [Ruminococcus sp.]